MVDRKLVYKELDKVLDPEIGMPITEMGLVDKVSIKGSTVSVGLHFTTPMCPPAFGLKMGQDIKKFIKQVNGVKKVNVKVKNNYFSEQINKELGNY
jgi:ATP-binding protein involved in chromosome partitioning